MKTRILIVTCALLLGACESPTGNEIPARAATTPIKENSGIGVGYPNPHQILNQVFDRMEARDFEGMCAHLAAPNRSGAPVPLIPGKNIQAIPAGREDLWVNQERVAGFRHFINQPWNDVSYGQVRSLANDPPFIAVPIRVTYDWSRIPASERDMIARTWSHQTGRTLSFEEAAAAIESQQKGAVDDPNAAPELAFVYLGDRWRLFLGPIPRRS